MAPVAEGVFAQWQPQYAALGLSTFPVKGKLPAVRGYLRLNAQASAALVVRFADCPGLGLALQPAGLTVLDVDTPDEHVLADALSRHGPTPFVVRSGSGHFQAWYRHGGEGRSIRPDPYRPIDILGNGFVVAPPSRGTHGPYRIIEGTLEDLADLPVLQNAPVARTTPSDTAGVGRRNDALWRHCMQAAHHCDDFATLLDVAQTQNEGVCPPLEDAEVVKTARSAWGYTVRGENWLGRGKRLVTTFDEIDGLLRTHPDAFILLTILRRHHDETAEFVVANAMAAAMPGGGWTRKRIAAARGYLEASGLLEEVRRSSHRHGPAIYRLKRGQN